MSSSSSPSSNDAPSYQIADLTHDAKQTVDMPTVTSSSTTTTPANTPTLACPTPTNLTTTKSPLLASVKSSQLTSTFFTGMIPSGIPREGSPASVAAVAAAVTANKNGGGNTLTVERVSGARICVSPKNQSSSRETTSTPSSTPKMAPAAAAADTTITTMTQLTLTPVETLQSQLKEIETQQQRLAEIPFRLDSRDDDHEDQDDQNDHDDRHQEEEQTTQLTSEHNSPDSAHVDSTSTAASFATTTNVSTSSTTDTLETLDTLTLPPEIPPAMVDPLQSSQQVESTLTQTVPHQDHFPNTNAPSYSPTQETIHTSIISSVEHQNITAQNEISPLTSHKLEIDPGTMGKSIHLLQVPNTDDDNISLDSPKSQSSSQTFSSASTLNHISSDIQMSPSSRHENELDQTSLNTLEEDQALYSQGSSPWQNNNIHQNDPNSNQAFSENNPLRLSSSKHPSDFDISTEDMRLKQTSTADSDDFLVLSKKLHISNDLTAANAPAISQPPPQSHPQSAILAGLAVVNAKQTAPPFTVAINADPPSFSSPVHETNNSNTDNSPILGSSNSSLSTVLLSSLDNPAEIVVPHLSISATPTKTKKTASAKKPPKLPGQGAKTSPTHHAIVANAELMSDDGSVSLALTSIGMTSSQANKQSKAIEAQSEPNSITKVISEYRPWRNDACLDLSSFNMQSSTLNSIWPTILTLKGIRTLDLSKNQLKTIPQDLGKLQTIKVLKLSGNDLSNLPASIAELSDLVHIDLSNNALTQIPSTLDQLTLLEEIDLSNNSIEKCNIFNFPSSLFKLNLSNNKLVTFHQISAPGLTELLLSKNNLKKFPSFSSLPELSVLKCDGNSLEPDSSAFELSVCTKLSYLDISENPRMGCLPVDLIFSSTLQTLVAGNTNGIGGLVTDHVTQGGLVAIRLSIEKQNLEKSLHLTTCESNDYKSQNTQLQKQVEQLHAEKTMVQDTLDQSRFEFESSSRALATAISSFDSVLKSDKSHANSFHLALDEAKRKIYYLETTVKRLNMETELARRNESYWRKECENKHKEFIELSSIADKAEALELKVNLREVELRELKRSDSRDLSTRTTQNSTYSELQLLLKTRNKQLKQFRKANADLKTESETLKKHVVDQNTRIVTLTAALKQSAENIKHQNEMMKKMKIENVILFDKENRDKNVINNKIQDTPQVEALLKQVRILEAENEEMKQNTDKLNHENSVLRHDLEYVSSNLQEALSQKQTKDKELDKVKILYLQSLKESTSKPIKKNNNKSSKAKSLSPELEHRISKLQTETDIAAAKVIELEKAKRELKISLTDAEKALLQKEKTISVLQARVRAFDEIDLIEKSSSENDIEKEKLEKALETHQQEAKTFGRLLGAAKLENSKLVSQNKSLVEKIEEIKITLESAECKFKAAQNDLLGEKNRVGVLRGELSASDDTKRRLEMDIQKLTGDVKSKNSAIMVLNSSLQEANSRLVELDANLESTQQKIKEVEAENRKLKEAQKRQQLVLKEMHDRFSMTEQKYAKSCETLKEKISESNRKHVLLLNLKDSVSSYQEKTKGALEELELTKEKMLIQSDQLIDLTAKTESDAQRIEELLYEVQILKDAVSRKEMTLREHSETAYKVARNYDKKIKELTSIIDVKTVEFGEAQQEIEHAKNVIKERDAEISLLSDRIDTLENKLNETVGQLVNKVAECEQLTKSLVDNEQYADHLRNVLQKTDTDLKSTRAAFQKSQQEVQDLSEENMRLAGRCSNEREEIEKLTKSLQSTELSLGTSLKEIEKLQDTCAKLNQKLEVTKAEADQRQHELKYELFTTREKLIRENEAALQEAEQRELKVQQELLLARNTHIREKEVLAREASERENGVLEEAKRRENDLLREAKRRESEIQQEYAAARGNHLLEKESLVEAAKQRENELLQELSKTREGFIREKAALLEEAERQVHALMLDAEQRENEIREEGEQQKNAIIQEAEQQVNKLKEEFDLKEKELKQTIVATRISLTHEKEFALQEAEQRENDLKQTLAITRQTLTDEKAVAAEEAERKENELTQELLMTREQMAKKNQAMTLAAEQRETELMEEITRTRLLLTGELESMAQKADRKESELNSELKKTREILTSEKETIALKSQQREIEMKNLLATTRENLTNEKDILAKRVRILEESLRAAEKSQESEQRLEEIRKELMTSREKLVNEKLVLERRVRTLEENLSTFEKSRKEEEREKSRLIGEKANMEKRVMLLEEILKAAEKAREAEQREKLQNQETVNAEKSALEKRVNILEENLKSTVASQEAEQRERERAYEKFLNEEMALEKQIKVLEEKLAVAEESQQSEQKEKLAMSRNLMNEKDVLKQRVKTLEESLKTVENLRETQQRGMSSTLEKILKEKEEWEKHIKLLEGNLKASEQSYQNERQEKMTLIRNLTSEKELLENRVNVLETTLKASEQSQKAEREEKMATRSNLASEKEILLNRIGALEASLKASEQSEEAERQEKMTLRRTLMNEKEELESTVKSLEQSLKAAENMCRDQASKISDLEKSIQTNSETSVMTRGRALADKRPSSGTNPELLYLLTENVRMQDQIKIMETELKELRAKGISESNNSLNRPGSSTFDNLSDHAGIAAAASSIASMQIELATKEKAIIKLKNFIHVINTRLHVMEQESADREAKLEETEDALRKSLAQIKTLEDSNGKSEVMNSLKDEITALQTEIRKLQRDLVSANLIIVKQNENLMESKHNFEEELIALQEKLKEKEHQIVDLEHVVAGLRNKYDAREFRAEVEMNHLKKENEKMKTEVEKLDELMRSKEIELIKTKSKLGSLPELENEIRSLKELVTQQREKERALVEQLSACSLEANDTLSRLNEVEKRSSNQLMELESRLVQTKHDLESAQSGYDGLRIRLSEMARQGVPISKDGIDLLDRAKDQKNPVLSSGIVCTKFVLDVGGRKDIKAFLIGNDSAIGAWILDKAIEMTLDKETQFARCETFLPREAGVEYKYVLQMGSNTIWEKGANRSLDLSRIGSCLEVHDVVRL